MRKSGFWCHDSREIFYGVEVFCVAEGSHDGVKVPPRVSDNVSSGCTYGFRNKVGGKALYFYARQHCTATRSRTDQRLKTKADIPEPPAQDAGNGTRGS